MGLESISQQHMIYFLIICLFFLFFCFIFPRNDLMAEPFTDVGVGIQSVLENRQNMPLSQYMIMAAYDAAYDGSMVTTKQIRAVLESGCRFLDFEVFYNDLSVNRPYIGYSTDPTFNTIQGIDSNVDKRVTLNTVLTTIAANSFGTLATNMNDPVFIHLRIKSNNTNVYKMVAQDIKSSITSRMFLDQSGKAIQVDKSTLMKDIMGKIIVVVDRTLNTNYLQYSHCTETLNVNALAPPCLNLGNYVNMESGGTNWRTIQYNPPTNVNDMTKGGVESPIVNEKTNSMGIVIGNNSSVEMFMVVPAAVPVTNTNPDIISASTYISDLGCQTLCYRFYIQDSGLAWYKGLFRLYKTAFIPMGYAVTATSSKNIKTAKII